MAIVQRGIRVEITKQLSHEAAETFAQWIGCYTVIWNCKVAENREYYKAHLGSQTQNLEGIKQKPSQAVAHFKSPERPWLEKSPSQIRRNAGTKFVEALNACFKGLRKAPNFKNKYSKRNCLITNELFEVTMMDNSLSFSFKRTNKSKPFCQVEIKRSEKTIDIPNMVWITRLGARFWLSYSYTQELPSLREGKTIIEQLKYAPSEYQSRMVLGLDLGIVKPIALSNGQDFGFTPEEEKAIQRKHQRRIRYQRKASRQREMAKKQKIPTGTNYQKSKAKLADKHAQIAYLRINMAHRVSKTIAEHTPEIVVCEKLQIKNMTKRPKAKQDPVTGKWLVNGASRKAGLNKGILNVGWGRIIHYTEYKLRERDKLLVKLSAPYTSQTCLACGFISKLNRQSQALFRCIQCNHMDNADHNAAAILKKRFLDALNTDKFVLSTKTVKKIAVRKQKAARMAVSVCGANVTPIRAIGSG